MILKVLDWNYFTRIVLFSHLRVGALLYCERDSKEVNNNPCDTLINRSQCWLIDIPEVCSRVCVPGFPPLQVLFVLLILSSSFIFFSCQVLFSSLWCLWSIFFSLSLSCLIFLFILSTLFIFNSSFSIILVALPGATRPRGLGTWDPMQCSKLVSNHTSLQPVFIYIYRSFMCFLLLSLSLCVKGMWRVGF